jgi:hypothetical protein
MGKSKKPKQPVADYYMSLHYGVSLGPVDAITGLYYGEKEMWAGEYTSAAEIAINKPDLFGGVKKEGGTRGTAHYLPGAAEQTLAGFLCAKFGPGRTPANTPGFRGLATIFFTGGASAGGFGNSFAGFYWSSNQPYLKEIWARVRRIPRTLRPDLARIGEDANPACMIFECLVDQEWGMGAPTSIIDVPSFEAAAETLFDEAFGLSMIWAKSTTIENFVQEVLDHVQATVFVNPRTGLLTIKLIRDDFDRDTLPIYTPDNAKLMDFQRKSWGELSNEIVVTWTNPENEQEETVTLQDLAAISNQGAIISDARNYYGVRTVDLAMELCARDLRSAASPLAIVNMECNREAWATVPGDVIKVVWPEYGLDGVVMRVGQVDYGKPGEQRVRVSLTEDIFSLTTSSYTVPQGTKWVDPSLPPEPFERVQILSSPAFLLAQYIDLPTAEYPDVMPLFLAEAPNEDTYSFEIDTQLTDPAGTQQWQNVGKLKPQARGSLQTPFAREAVSHALSFGQLTEGEGPTLGGFVVIGEGTDADVEIALLTGYDAITGFVLRRGVLDTVPRAWPAGTPVWMISKQGAYIYQTGLPGGSSVDFKLRPQTTLGILPFDVAPITTAALIDRPFRPNRPANVTINGNPGWTRRVIPDATPVDMTWANRNRLMEDVTAPGWTDATMPPEVGQTTKIEIRDNLGNVLTTHANLPGTSFSIPFASFGDVFGSVVIRVSAVRDGLESLQAFEIPVLIEGRIGYGWDYGFNYGGQNF